MRYHALFVIFEKAEKFENVVCGTLWVKMVVSWNICGHSTGLLLMSSNLIWQEQ